MAVLLNVWRNEPIAISWPLCTERDKERVTERATEWQRQTETDREWQSDRDRQRQTESDRDRQSDRERDRETETDRETDRQREWPGDRQKIHNYVFQCASIINKLTSAFSLYLPINSLNISVVDSTFSNVLFLSSLLKHRGAIYYNHKALL